MDNSREEQTRIVCPKCNGRGKIVYSNTSTYMHGIGGQALTEDLCEVCWGSGRKDQIWTNVRELKKEVRRMARYIFEGGEEQ